MKEPAIAPEPPPPPRWSTRVRRWWSTWIWLPAPTKPHRGAEPHASSPADDDERRRAACRSRRASAAAARRHGATCSPSRTSTRSGGGRCARPPRRCCRGPCATTPRRSRSYPAYRVNFDGAFRYRLLAEHHPDDFAELRRWVDAGRWQVAGATWDAMDVNLPSPESLVRHVLYGRRWFRQHLGRDPRDLFLPDCFGFGAQVPVVAAHCGLVGFATSKLRRFDDVRAAFGVPFPLGWWEGVDGSRLLAALDPGGYGEPLLVPPGEDPEVQSPAAPPPAAAGPRRRRALLRHRRPRRRAAGEVAGHAASAPWTPRARSSPSPPARTRRCAGSPPSCPPTACPSTAASCCCACTAPAATPRRWR